MPNIMIVGHRPNTRVDVYGECQRMIKVLNLGDDSVVTSVPDVGSNLGGEKILMYGFPFSDPKSSPLPYEIMKTTSLSTHVIKSTCVDTGEKLKHCPHLVVITSKDKISKVVADLKSLHLGYDVEIHLRDSNIHWKARDPFYIRVKLLENEVEHAKDIIDYLMKLGITRNQIWVSIIDDFVPADKMK